MTSAQIDKLLSEGELPEMTELRELRETHISWVVICDHFVYKIKKPLKYPFLDFSTLALRKHFCEREMELNQRLAKNIYLKVLPIYKVSGAYRIGGTEGTLLDYALKMQKMDPEKQMDVLLAKNKVGPKDIRDLAECIVAFHKKTDIVRKNDVTDLREKFNALEVEKGFLSETLGLDSNKTITRAINFSNAFLDHNRTLLHNRSKKGFVRDCHGDLHTRNIFLLPAPLPFDCIEFNDAYRHIDVLDEVAFLCMDLDALGRRDLSDLFITHYNHLFPVIGNEDEARLFIYYKSYRANIRAKVNSLRARSAADGEARTKALQGARTYLELMDFYINALQ